MRRWLLIPTMIALSVSASGEDRPSKPVGFREDVAPILVAKCLA